MSELNSWVVIYGKEDALQDITATFPDFLTENLVLTHELEHEIRLKDPLPVGYPRTGWHPLKFISCGSMWDKFWKMG